MSDSLCAGEDDSDQKKSLKMTK